MILDSFMFAEDARKYYFFVFSLFYLLTENFKIKLNYSKTRNDASEILLEVSFSIKTVHLKNRKD